MATLKEKVSQLFICKTPNNFSEIEKFAKEGIGGFMIGKGGEITTPEQKNMEGDTSKSLKKFTSSIKKIQTKNKTIPLFMAIDGEGGDYFNRLKNISKYKSQREYGIKFEKNHNLRYFEKKVSKYAKLMNKLNLNMNFAPLLDIAKEGYMGYVAEEKIKVKHPELTVSEIESSHRSYSDKKDTVRTLGVKSMEIFQKHGIIPTLKHFPSYGILNIDENPHIKLSKPNLSKKDLEKHIENYRIAFKKGAYSIMTGHIITAIDRTCPASLSKKNYEYIRKDLKFKGLIVSDELNMGSVKEYFGSSYANKAAIAAIKANDIVLISHPDKFESMRNTIISAAEKHKEIRDIINDRYKRILRYKRKIGIIKK